MVLERSVAMSNSITISELDAATTAWLDQEAQRSGEPVEHVIQRLIRRGIEAEQGKHEVVRHHDLDTLAGTWSDEEAAEFLRSVEDLNQIDSGLWK